MGLIFLDVLPDVDARLLRDRMASRRAGGILFRSRPSRCVPHVYARLLRWHIWGEERSVQPDVIQVFFQMDKVRRNGFYATFNPS